jgi:hypothetical protein
VCEETSRLFLSALQRYRALCHELLQALMRVLERLFRQDTLGNVLGVPNHIRSFAGFFVPHVPVEPQALFASVGDHAHEPTIHGLLSYTLEILVEQMLHGWGEKLPQIPPYACLRRIAKGAGGSRVDQEQHPFQVMDTQQSQAMFHQVLVLSVAFS